MLTTTTPPPCKWCKKRTDKIGRLLHEECVDAWLTHQRAKKQAAEKKERRAQSKVERAQDRQRRHALKRLNDFKADAQTAFNAFIRGRDAALPCVSCGEANPPMKPGGQWDAGHFLSRGAYPELAFDEDNCHKQCKSCNAGSGKFSHKARTVSEQYEAGLLERVGAERLAALKAPHPPVRRRQADFEALTATYRQKLRDLPRGATTIGAIP